MPTLHLFMLEVKCFTLHWRRQNRVIFMLLFYTSKFMFINIFYKLHRYILHFFLS
uniref:Uncharacterized protein n=1 Tax=Spermophilus dauricus TaxID=99837 RepID=A0A8C9PJV5_SPEDA